MPSTAIACVWLPVPQQSQAEKRNWSHEQTQERTKEAKKRLATGTIDAAIELSELLVPNVRAVTQEYSSCGPEGEIDFAGGRENTDPAFAVRNDPRLTGFDLSDYRREIREFDGEIALGSTCNAEFRARFAEWLRTMLSTDDLQQIWLFLAPRKRERSSYGSVYHRLIIFDRDTRRPPTRWWGADQWIDKDLTRFVTKDRRGRQLAAVMSDYWEQNGPDLENDELTCPRSAQQWQVDRERLIATILRAREARIQRRKGVSESKN